MYLFEYTKDDKLQVFKISMDIISMNGDPPKYRYSCDSLLDELCKMQLYAGPV